MKNIKIITLFIIASLVLSVMALPVLADGEGTAAPTTTTGKTTLSENYATKRYSTNEEKLATMELVHSEYGYDLYYHPETAEVQIVNTKTGQYLSTNPFDVGATANKSTEKEKLLSQLIVNYADGSENKSMNSYSMAAVLNQIKMNKIRGGIRVEYTIGQASTKRVLPMMIEKTRFEELILAPLEESADPDTYKMFKSYYMLKDPNAPGLSQSEIETLYNTLPITRQMAVYVIDPSVAGVQRELNVFERLITSNTKYTYDDVIYDHELTGYTGAIKNPAVFRMALEYYVTEEGLEVRLPARGIRYDAKQYTLNFIKILPYMGAYEQAQKGYVVLPDGSGTLVRFEDTDVEMSTTISNRLYAEDYSFYTQKTVANMEDWTLPIYGMVENTGIEYDEFETLEDGSVVPVTKVRYEPKGFFAIITEGDSLAEITTTSGGILNKYFATSINVYPRPSDTYPLEGISVSGGIATWTVETDKKYTGNYRIKYIMMDGEEANYVTMAKLFRDWLEKNGKLEKTTLDSDTELYIEAFGSIDTTKRVLGVPVDTMKPLTSFEDAKNMVDDFAKAGINNLSIKYTGWANGGINATAPTRVKVEKALGGEKGLRDLIKYATDKGVKIYPDYDFTYISNFSSGDKFDIKDDTVKTVDDRSALHRTYSPVYQTFYDDGKLIISPNKIKGFYELISEDFADLGTGAIALSTLGSDLNSDHNKDDSLNREDSKERVEELLAKVKEDGYRIMVDAGNAYSIKYVTDIINMPLDSSNRSNASEAIPLTGLIFHGYKNYAGSAINLAGDFNNTILKTVENGASLYFLLSSQNVSELKARYGDRDYYSIRYDYWKDDVISTYKIVNKILSPVQNATVISHEFITKRLVEMVYSNGITITLDYDKYTITSKGDFGEVFVDLENSTITENGSTKTFAEFSAQ